LEAITCDNLVKDYKAQKPARAIDHVTLNVTEGECFRKRLVEDSTEKRLEVIRWVKRRKRERKKTLRI